jgi:hypothetical protein
VYNRPEQIVYNRKIPGTVYLIIDKTKDKFEASLLKLVGNWNDFSSVRENRVILPDCPPESGS